MRIRVEIVACAVWYGSAAESDSVKLDEFTPQG